MEHIPIDGEDPEPVGDMAPPSTTAPQPGTSLSPSSSSTADNQNMGDQTTQTRAGCLNNCSIHLDVRRGVCSATLHCLCLRGKYYDEDCSLVYCPNDCSGRGKCDPKIGVCTCVEGAAGVDCSQDWCVPANCSGHGVCGNDMQGHNPICHCKSPYAGPICDQIQGGCATDCGAHGVCRNGLCYCDSGWRGASCQMEKCSGNCNHHGVCSIDKTSLTETSPIFEGCTCNHGYAPPDCSRAVCGGIACTHAHTVCASNSTECVCDVGWSGSDCSTSLCPTACSFNGVCQQGDKANSFICKCDQGWGGVDCSQRHTATAP